MTNTELLRERTQTGFGSFIRSLWSSWVSRITGPASAVLVLVAFVVRDTAKLPTSIAAVLCLIVASYEAWRNERIRSNTAQARLKSSFRFDLEHSSCQMKEGAAIYLRIALWNTGVETIDDCVIHISSASPSPLEWIGRYPIPLHIMHAENGAPLVLRNGQPALIDFAVFTPGAQDLTIMHGLAGKVAVFVPARSFSFVLEAVGRGVKARSQTFYLDLSIGYPQLATS